MYMAGPVAVVGHHHDVLRQTASADLGDQWMDLAGGMNADQRDLACEKRRVLFGLSHCCIDFPARLAHALQPVGARLRVESPLAMAGHPSI